MMPPDEQLAYLNQFPYPLATVFIKNHKEPNYAH